MRALIDYRPALRGRSGVGEYTHHLVRALTKLAPRDLDLFVFSSSWKDRLSTAPDLSGVTVVDRRVPVSVLNLAWHRLGWPSAEFLTGQRYDVTHSLHPLLMPSRAAAQVVTIHDLYFLSHPERTRAEIRRDYSALTGAHAHRADRIIVPSAYTAGEVERQLGVPRDRISICPSGAPDWKPRQAAPQDGYVLFIGTLELRKNVGALLDAYQELIERRFAVPELRLAGATTAHATEWLARIDRAPLKGVVRHLGYVEPTDTRRLYEGARLLVMPSFDEGFGIPVLEAMTLGVPVVAARRGSLPEVLGDAGPLVDPMKPAEIADAIAKVLSDPAFAARCTDRGIARSAQFRWETTARRVYDTYREAIEHHAHRH
ncbi:MAG TPA: glycosyltransferase family 1 protein [Vicinamibacterales bacterium]